MIRRWLCFRFLPISGGSILAYDSCAPTVPLAPAPAKPEKCRRRTKKRLRALKGPKAPDAFLLNPDAIERAWIAARCRACAARPRCGDLQ